MAKEYTFNVNNLKRNNDSNNGVIKADFTCWILEGTYQASLTFSKEFTPNPSSGEYIAYSSLTENNVIGWLTEDEKNSLKFDNQHNEFIWLTKGELLNHKLVHDNTKNYFK